MNNKMILLVGPIASGKSSFVRRFLAEDIKREWMTLEMDAVVESLHGGSYTLYDPKCKENIYDKIRDSILRLVMLGGKNILVDRTNMTEADRKKYLDAAMKHNYSVHVVLFDWTSPENHAARRMTSNSRGYTFDQWTAIAKSQVDSYEPITESEFGVVDNVFYFGSNENIDSLLAVL